MDFKRYLIKCWPDMPLPPAAKMAASPLDCIAPDDHEVEVYMLLALHAQGKLFSIEDVLAEFENELD